MRNKYMLIGVGIVAGVLLSSVVFVLAGSVDSPGLPSATLSYTLADIYNRLDTGAAGAQSTFTEPGVAPGTGTMHTLNEIMAKAPAADNTNGATTAQVLTGKTFWGLRTDGTWGTKSGTAAAGDDINGANGDKTFNIPDGFYSGKTATANDSDLQAGNIVQGVNIFGVAGSAIAATGNATAGDVLTGKTFSNASAAGIAGTMPNNGAVTIVPTTTNQTIALGYHNGSGKVEGDADLVASKIKSSVDIFGVTGTVIEATGNATAGDVLTGKTFSNAGAAGIAGTMPDKEGDNASTAQAQSGGVNYFTAPQGYYDGDDRVSATDAQVRALDADITAGNIKKDVNIFGQVGTLTPDGGTAAAADLFNGKTAHLTGDWTLDTGTLNLACNTSTFNGTANLVADDYDGAGGNGSNRWCTTDSGDAAAGDILQGKKAWVDGSEVTGNVAAGSNVNGPDGSKTFDIPNGFYSGKTATANDSDLQAGNIKSGVSIFGVTGTYPLSGVPKTGQTTKYVDGDDGDLEKGVAWPSPRFTDNVDNNGDGDCTDGGETCNGTVTDNLTGLIWLKNANCFGSVPWSSAVSYARTLNDSECGLSDGSVEGDWWLPNVREMQSLLDYSTINPALPSGHPFTGVAIGTNWYWTSTTYGYSGGTNYAWRVSVAFGNADHLDPKTYSEYVWPVRGGQ